MTGPATLHSIGNIPQPPDFLMAPGTGTPDCAASSYRSHSTGRQESRARIWLPAALVSITIVLGGCTSQPRAPDSPAHAKIGGAVEDPNPSKPDMPSTSAVARSGQEQPLSANRIPVPLDPTVVGVIDDGSERFPRPQLVGDSAAERDTWDRIREQMDLPLAADKRVRRALAWYGRNPDYLNRLTHRARPFLAYIVREVEKRDLPMEFALLPVVESAFKVRAYSRVGASGLWQFMPSTGRRYGLDQNWWYDGRRDIVESTRAALDYLTELLEEFNDDPLLAVAAYNWGEGNLRRALARNRARGKPTDVWSLRLPRETQVHVSRLVAIAEVVERPEEYGVVLNPIPDRVQFRQVPIDGPIHLAFAAHLAGITLDELRLLNPGFRRAATAPGGPHLLQLPSGAVERFTAGFAELSGDRQLRWARHIIARGDTLGAIAGQYGTSVGALKDANGLSSDRIFAGDHLMIPVALANGDALRFAVPASAQSASNSLAEVSRKTIHHVRSGDSLWRIANKHGVDVRQLAAWNDLPIESVLHPGQKLRLIPAAYTNSTTGQERIRYRVKRGDSLWEISRQFGVSVSSLRRWNRMSGNETLMPGRELFVHPAPAI